MSRLTQRFDVGLLDALRKIFASSSSENDPEGLYLWVQCDNCGQILQIRLSRQHDLSRDFQQGGLFVRKVAVDDKCFRPIELSLRFDSGSNELTRDISGGRFVTREDYEAARQSSERPTPSSGQ